jgi:predicted SnoaL-like aldol condensation-catalyzing enzyme
MQYSFFYCNRWRMIVISLPGHTERESLAQELRRPEVSQSTVERNKALVLEAFETLFNKKDFVAAEKFWSSNYIQHSAHIPPGRDGLFGLVKSGPPGMKYENSLILAEGDMVMLHGRFSGIGLPANWIVVDIVRIENGLLAEHWDVIEDEVTREKSASGLPMFGEAFPS